MRTAVAYLRTATMDAAGLSRQRQIIGAWAEREQLAIVAYVITITSRKLRSGVAAADSSGGEPWRRSLSGRWGDGIVIQLQRPPGREM